MSNDVAGTLRDALLRAVENAGGGDTSRSGSQSGGGMSGMKGIAAGAGAAALLPLAIKNAGRIARTLGVEDIGSLVRDPGRALEGLSGSVGDHVGSSLGDKVSETVDQAGGPAGIIKDVLPFGGGGGGGQKGGAPGVGKGRRMPVQQSVDIGVPIETVYNQFTQFEDWPNFMHRVKRLTQDDDCTVTFQVKIWGKNKEFTAKIDTQRPDERIKWEVTQGMTHRGVVTFHELGPNLTRVLLSFDVEPGGMIEKAARGMRYVKRAARADLHRFKAFIEYAEQETGAWRGTIEDGEVTEEHDPSYDEQREYADIDDLVYSDDSGDSDEDEDGEDEAERDEEGESPEDDASEDEETSAQRSGDDEDSHDDRSGSGSGPRSRGGRSQAAQRRDRPSRNGDDDSSQGRRRRSRSQEEGRTRARSGQGAAQGGSSRSRRGSSNGSGSGSGRRSTRSRSDHSSS